MLFRAVKHPALWLTERAGRLSVRSVDDAFRSARTAAAWIRRWTCTACDIRT